MTSSWYICSNSLVSTSGTHGLKSQLHVLRMWMDTISRISTNGQITSKWKLCCHGIKHLKWRHTLVICHDDVIKWKHFPCHWPFVRVIHRSLVNSPYKGQWRWSLMNSLICAWTNGWVNNRDAGDLRRLRPHYDVNVMAMTKYVCLWQ